MPLPAVCRPIRVSRRSAALAAVALVLALGAPSSARACVGGPLLELIDPEADTYEDVAEVIFTGTAVRREDPAVALGSTRDPVFWTFVVDGVEYGQVGNRFTVTSPRSDASCGVTFTLGARYRVLAWGGDTPGSPEVLQGNGTEQVASLASAPPVEGTFKRFSPLGLLLAPIEYPLVGITLLAALIVGWWRLRPTPSTGDPPGGGTPSHDRG